MPGMWREDHWPLRQEILQRCLPKLLQQCLEQGQQEPGKEHQQSTQEELSNSRSTEHQRQNQGKEGTIAQTRLQFRILYQ